MLATPPTNSLVYTTHAYILTVFIGVVVDGAIVQRLTMNY